LKAGILGVTELNHASLVEGDHRERLASPVQVGPDGVVGVGGLATDLTDPIGLSLGVSDFGTIRTELEARGAAGAATGDGGQGGKCAGHVLSEVKNIYVS
jgi:hypothetical protein